MADAVADALAAVGVNKGQEGMPKPSDIIKFETEKQPATPPAPSPAAPPVTPPVVPPVAPPATPPVTPPATPPAPVTPLAPYTQTEIDALLVKIDTGTQLSPDETAMAAAISRVEELSGPPTPPASAMTYKIGDRTYNETEALQLMRTDTKIGNLDISKEAEGRLLQTWLKAQNRTEFSQTVTRNAEELSAERNRIAVERARIEQRAILLRQESEKLTRTKKELEAIAALPVTEADIEDPTTGKPNYTKLTEYQQKMTAQRSLASVTQQEQELIRQQSEASANQLGIEIQSVIAAHPQFKTEGDVFQLWEKVLRNEVISTDADRMKVLELHDLFNASRMKGISVENEIALRKAQRTLAHPDLPVQPANGGAASLLPDQAALSKTWAEKIRAHRTRISAAPPATPAPGGTPHVQPPPPIPVAQSLIKEDNQILGNSSGDPFVQSLGYK